MPRNIIRVSMPSIQGLYTHRQGLVGNMEIWEYQNNPVGHFFFGGVLGFFF